MPRNMSFSMTTDQVRHRTKTVTRRLGWKNLKPGQILNACVKCMGLRPGEQVERICKIRVRSVIRLELAAMLNQAGNGEATAEGFPQLSNAEFVQMFCRSMNCEPWHVVTRIEFEYVDEE